MENLIILYHVSSVVGPSKIEIAQQDLRDSLSRLHIAANNALGVNRIPLAELVDVTAKAVKYGYFKLEEGILGLRKFLRSQGIDEAKIPDEDLNKVLDEITETSDVKPKENGKFEGSSLDNVSQKSKVWDDIVGTQPLYDVNSLIYKSFEIKVGNNKIWVHGNATEHLRELELNILNDISKTPELKRLGVELILTDFQGALKEVTKNGLKYDELMNAGRWEFKLSSPREVGQLPALIHAQPK